MNRSSVRFLILVTLCIVPFGCGEKRPDDEIEQIYAIEREFRKGDAPITVRVKISHESLTIADLLTFLIEVEQGEGVKAELPELEEMDFGQFVVRDSRAISEEVEENGSSTFGISYVLEPQLSGKYILQPFEVRFSIENEEPKGSEGPILHSITTAAFTIKIKSLIEGDPSAADIKPIQGPVDLPKKGMDRKRLTIVIAATVLTIALIGLVIIIGRRRKAKEIIRKIPPHDAALEALARLRNKKLIEKGLVKEFYYEISNIMRHYIEDRFGLSAPEHTTEEFLSSISRDGHFDPRTQTLLGSFLEHCDMVKFARYAPETEEIQQTFNVTRTFIQETKLEHKNGV